MRNRSRGGPEREHTPLERCWYRLPKFFLHQVTFDQAGMQAWAKEARAFPELREMAEIVDAFVDAIETTQDAVDARNEKDSKIVDLDVRRATTPRRPRRP
jgi:hypothetical protein